MTSVGQLCLLIAMVCFGYAAFVLVACRCEPTSVLHRVAISCGNLATVAIVGAVLILASALVQRDFQFDYVARYSSLQLPWHYSLSALWVGQAGSLLVWSWILAGLAFLFRSLPTADVKLRNLAHGIVIGFLAVLVAIMVFAADPFKPSLSPPAEGLGLGPLLQHPSMLVHPPVVFFAYSAWTFPFALAMAALILGRLDVTWVHMARPWALLAWTVLLAGLLLGAHWAYQELGWGGYWAWDPVENASLLPWLTGTAFIHCLMAWRRRDCLKRTTVSLAIGTFTLCSFATFLTRSGLFSSVHAFSTSSIGWLFLGLTMLQSVVGVALVLIRWRAFASRRVVTSLVSRETVILISTVLLLTCTVAVLAGTIVMPLSELLLDISIQVDAEFYNRITGPIAVFLLLAAAAAPLLRWGQGPGLAQRLMLVFGGSAGGVAAIVGHISGMHTVAAASVTGLSVFAVASFVGAVLLDIRGHWDTSFWHGLWKTLRLHRQQYTGYVIHFGFAAFVIGVTGSSLGHRQHEVTLNEGDTVHWADYQIRLTNVRQYEAGDKLIAESILEVSKEGASPTTLKPARHWHRQQDEWTSEVAIQSTWASDFYTVLNAGLEDGRVVLTFIENPMVRWIWLGGSVACAGGLSAIWPGRGLRRGAGMDYAASSTTSKAAQNFWLRRDRAA